MPHTPSHIKALGSAAGDVLARALAAREASETPRIEDDPQSPGLRVANPAELRSQERPVNTGPASRFGEFPSRSGNIAKAEGDAARNRAQSVSPAPTQTRALTAVGRTADQGLIEELDQDFLANLESRLQFQELEGVSRIGREQERRGLFRSGLTSQRIGREVVEPGIAARREALIGLSRESALRGREERLGETAFERQRQFASEGFERQRQFAGEEFERGGIIEERQFERQRQLESERFVRRLDELQRSAVIQQNLLRLQDQLEGRDEGGFGEIFGQVAGGFAGSFTGGLGGGLGARAGKALFS